jgi:hypothetical protein
MKPSTGYRRNRSPERSEDTEFMELTIVWRNPHTLVRFARTLQRVGSNEYGTVYAVTSPDLTQAFQVIPGDVA